MSEGLIGAFELVISRYRVRGWVVLEYEDGNLGTGRISRRAKPDDCRKRDGSSMRVNFC